MPTFFLSPPTLPWEMQAVSVVTGISFPSIMFSFFGMLALLPVLHLNKYGFQNTPLFLFARVLKIKVLSGGKWRAHHVYEIALVHHYVSDVNRYSRFRSSRPENGMCLRWDPPPPSVYVCIKFGSLTTLILC